MAFDGMELWLVSLSSRFSMNLRIVLQFNEFLKRILESNWIAAITFTPLHPQKH